MRSGSEATGNASTSRPCIETGARRVFVFVDVLGVKPVDKVPETTNAPLRFWFRPTYSDLFSRTHIRERTGH